MIIARMPINELGMYLLKGDVHPPLYFMLLHLWLIGGEDITYLRLFSVLTGVLSIGGIYLLSRQLFEKRVDLISALILAISPLHIYYSQMVRNYSLFIDIERLARTIHQP